MFSRVDELRLHVGDAADARLENARARLQIGVDLLPATAAKAR